MEFRAQVPSWLPIDEDVVVVASSVVELCLAVALLTTWKQPARGIVGVATAAFFVAIPMRGRWAAAGHSV